MLRLLFILLMTVCSVGARGAAIGTWNCFLAYSDITEIQPAGNKVYVLSSKGLFSYQLSDQSVQTYHKMNVLNDCNIAHITYCKAAHRLIIVYENQNIDLLDDNGDVVNISDYYNKSMTADKTINDVKVMGSNAFVATNFGILKINVADAEITATYNLGRKVMSTTVFEDELYAACGSEGIFKAKLSDNLLDKKNWTRESNVSANHIYTFDNGLMAAVNGVIYRKDQQEWKKIFDRYFDFCHLTGEKLIFGEANSVWIFEKATNPLIIKKGDADIKAFSYDVTNDCFWSNQADGKLYSLTLEDKTIVPKITNINPDGPKYNYFGFLTYGNNTLYSCGGGFDAFAELFREATVQTYSEDEWTIYQDDIKTTVGNLFQDMTCLDFDPKNPAHVFVGSRAGLYEYLNGRFIKHYNCENSPLKYSTADNNPNYILTLGVKFDKNGNLWCLNSLAEARSILELKTDGTWEDHHQEILMDDNLRSLPNMKSLIIDSRGLLWFANNHWSVPGFYCFDPKTEAINHYTSFINEDGTRLTPNGIRCVAEDKEGNIWIGSSVGPLLLPAEDINDGSNAVLQQVKVPRNDGTNFADYLLSGVDITCIAVDGGNRKWFGTNGNGAYLISDDNMSQIHHFLSSNSMLLSDNIESIAINDQTGEVFFGTDNGLCSFMSDATATNETMTKDNVYAYPNPVRPDYTGLITVTGLTMDADVKIVTANGTLVAEGRSNGGTFTWDGCDEGGKRVASGVYMVQTATSDGKKGTVCKIAIVR